MTALTATCDGPPPAFAAPSPGERSRAHTELVNACLLALSAAGIFAWRNPTGRAVLASGFVVPFGLKGSADILGFIPPTGRGLAIECKTGEARQKPQQRTYMARVAQAGALYIVARSVADLAPALRLVGARP